MTMAKNTVTAAPPAKSNEPPLTAMPATCSLVALMPKTKTSTVARARNANTIQLQTRQLTLSMTRPPKNGPAIMAMDIIVPLRPR